MILAVPYSHRDAAQALRLLKWIRFLESVKKSALSSSTLFLCASQTAARKQVHKLIQEEAALITKVWSHVALTEYEHGWPGACNHMFREVLETINGAGDIMLLEPDAIPLCPNWFDVIIDEWETRPMGQEFMGCYVKHDLPHMTGNAVYGKDWRKIAPKLAELQDERGWDTYAADQVLPKAKLIPLIQHVWGNPAISLELLSPDAVIFHQDKQGHLIALLDQENYGGEADRMTCYSKVSDKDVRIMTRYFFNANCNMDLVSQGLAFRFEVIDNIGGPWYGVFSTDKEDEALALEALVRANRIREIEEPEFRQWLESKKKAGLSPDLTPSATPQQPTAQVISKPALLVDDPIASGLKHDAAATTAAPAKSVDDVLKVAKVAPPEAPPKKKFFKRKTLP